MMNSVRALDPSLLGPPLRIGAVATIVSSGKPLDISSCTGAPPSPAGSSLLLSPGGSFGMADDELTDWDGLGPSRPPTPVSRSAQRRRRAAVTRYVLAFTVLVLFVVSSPMNTKEEIEEIKKLYSVPPVSTASPAAGAAVAHS